MIYAGDGMVVSGNIIYENGGMGIDLGGDGVTANDSGDFSFRDSGHFYHRY